MHASKQTKAAYDTCVEVLTQLGETIPEAVDAEDFESRAKNVQIQLSALSEQDLMNMKEVDNKTHYQKMKFCEHIQFFAFNTKPSMFKWYACRLVELSLEHGRCKYSAMGMMRFAMLLTGKIFYNVDEAYRVGKMAMKLIGCYNASELLPSAYLAFHGHVAVHVEPIQSIADMHKRGFEIGISIGDIHMALNNYIHYIQKALISGGNLPGLKKDCDYLIRLSTEQGIPSVKAYATAFQETIAMLIGSETAESEKEEEGDGKVRTDDSYTYHQVVQSFWLGHYKRCLFHAQKPSANSSSGKLSNEHSSFK